ncbi:MAG: CoA pyrophosphatase [Myxococcales bacterium]|nr:CoA pyrophosphatase [Myxococcales bacterium]
MAAVFTPSQRLLLMRRAEHPSDPWSGHISFPGGRVEPGDAGAVDAAIRETHEEVGLQLTADALLGPLDPIAAVGGRPGLVIRPYVFTIEREEPELRLSADEVASVHWLSLRRLLAREGRGEMTWSRNGRDLRLPCVDFDGQRLWGLTLAMVDGLIARIEQSRSGG